ncbi:MAG: riboflavin synthase [Nitriliruptoraceae bacterium]
MFTGIIEECGTVQHWDITDEFAVLTVRCTDVLADVSIGDSISVNGCCLTVTAFTADTFTVELMAATLRTTALGSLSVGDEVNLERAMVLNTRLGGHLVQGHVDGVGQVTALDDTVEGTVFLTLTYPKELARYIVSKGSLTINGVSLTVVTCDGETATIGLIPHTWKVTTFRNTTVGETVNLEVDVIAKYVEQLLLAGIATPYDPASATV